MKKIKDWIVCHRHVLKFLYHASFCIMNYFPFVGFWSLILRHHGRISGNYFQWLSSKCDYFLFKITIQILTAHFLKTFHQCLIGNKRVWKMSKCQQPWDSPLVCFKDQRAADVTVCDQIIPNRFACGRCSVILFYCISFLCVSRNRQHRNCFNNCWGYEMGYIFFVTNWYWAFFLFFKKGCSTLKVCESEGREVRSEWCHDG